MQPKYLFPDAILGPILLFIAWIASVFTFVYCMIIVIKTFMGKQRAEEFQRIPQKAVIGLIPPLILAGLVVIIFFYPNVLSQYLLQPAWNLSYQPMQNKAPYK